jgi:hypothetical protein
MTFDSLGEQTSKVAALGPALESAQQINRSVFSYPCTAVFLSEPSLRKHIQLQDRRQEEKIDEIKGACAFWTTCTAGCRLATRTG